MSSIFVSVALLLSPGPADTAAADSTAEPSPEASADGTSVELASPEDPVDTEPVVDDPPVEAGSGASPAGDVPVVPMDDIAGSALPASRPGTFPGPGGSRKKKGEGGGRLLSSRGGGPDAGGGDWGFIFNGYLRAPMRIGLGEREMPAEGQHATTLHNAVVPDDQYLGYQYTLHNPRDWAELYLGYGNQVAAGMVSIQGFNFTDAAWKENNAQFGIAQAFVSLTPKLPAKSLRLSWKVGSFDNRYGQAGRYDAGELDTYAFGRTHGMGEAGQLDILVRDFTISVEHGLGTTRPDPRVFNAARFTFFHHAHLGLAYQKKVELGGHFLQAIAREEDRLGAEADASFVPNPPDGSMTVLGPDLRINWGRLGYYYAAFSYIQARHARSVGPSIEVIHSKGAGQFTFGIIDNYLEGPTQQSGGNGEISSVIVQAENSVQRIRKGDQWWGEGMDFGIKLYGMLNKIRSDDPDADGITKIKYGIDARFDALRWFGVATRYDRVQPNSNIPEQSFSVVSPRLLFRTNWITREEISVQYSRYIYNQRECSPMGDPLLCAQPPSAPVPPAGFGATPGNQDMGNRGAPTRVPDQNVVSIRATFWW
ncbi:hypothetical protein [Paraliomyxa miuraensis]|uniref:hypothetical protein n=1 Tax=Paraliomyxa miuraensis TaxID=376150 RepID=UPI00224FD332|nr:hypothetical protein [Paraliomyxa miuraensis]MCX4244859.1 hypothetical protein [Paraliomyxa miuraensis]